MKIFIEQQKFTQLWLLILMVLLLVVVPLISFLNWDDITNDDEAFIVIIAVALVDLIIFGLVLSIKLMTRIDELGVHYKFYPLHLKFRTIPWAEISNCYIRKYGAIREFGGWGIKPGIKKNKGKSFTVKGNMGLQLELKNGKKILIGSQLHADIERTIHNYKHKYENTKDL